MLFVKRLGYIDLNLQDTLLGKLIVFSHSSQWPPDVWWMLQRQGDAVAGGWLISMPKREVRRRRRGPNRSGHVAENGIRNISRENATLSF